MRAVVLVLLLLSTAGAAPTADQYFDLGVEYLKKGLFRPARAAFAESLVRAPGQPVPTAFLALAGAAEGRTAHECAILLRLAYRRLPKGKALQLEVQRLLPSPRSYRLLERDYARRLRGARGQQRTAVLDVLAFLQVQDGDAHHAPALDLLLKEAPKDRYVRALARLRVKAPTP